MVHPDAGLPGDAFSTVAFVDLEALKHNAAVFMEAAPGIRMMGVVKADAYGHGAIPVSKALLSAGFNSLAVATVAEGIELRKAGIEADILVFGTPRRETVASYGSMRLDATATSMDSIGVLTEAGEAAGGIRVHLHIDTGMGRLGNRPEQVKEAVSLIDDAASLELAGISTHFSTAGEHASGFAARQWTLFRAIVEELDRPGLQVHAASSSAVFTVPESVRPPFVTHARIGVGLYGLLALPFGYPDPGFKPVMTLQTEVSHVKTVPAGTPVSYNRTWTAPEETRIATLAAGYADGVSRHLSNLGRVTIHGTQFPIVGSVCMDMFMVNLGPAGGSAPEVRPGDTATLFGKAAISAMEVAALTDTIPYEVVCRVSSRVPRIYSDRTVG